MQFKRTVFTPVLGLLLLFPLVSSGAEFHYEYEKALDITRQLSEKITSYEINGTLAMESTLEGQPGSQKMEVELRAAASLPDKLFVAQQGAQFQMAYGTSPKGSWYYLGQAGTFYQGEPVQLDRTFNPAAQIELDEDSVYSFFGGLNQFLLQKDLNVLPESSLEFVVVGGGEVKCRLFKVPAVDNGDGSGEGEKLFWFDEASGLVLKGQVSFYGQRGEQRIEQTITYWLDGYMMNKTPDRKAFEYTVPEGVTLVNTLEKLINPNSMVGDVAPEISFQAMDGKETKLSDYRGKVVFLDFWATWCGPCKMEMPHIQELYEKMGKSGDVIFIGASSEQKATIAGFLEKNPYTFDIVQVNQVDTAGKYKVESIPTGFVIDRDGVIRAHMVGVQNQEQLRAALAKAGI